MRATGSIAWRTASCFRCMKGELPMPNRKHSPKHGLLWGILIALTIIVALSLDAALHPASGFQPYLFRIVEVMTSNASALVNRDGILTDYIVVENTQDTSVSIGGWGLSDRSYQIRYLFPDISLQPGEMRYVYFSKKGYALPEKKELYLWLPDGQGSGFKIRKRAMTSRKPNNQPPAVALIDGLLAEKQTVK